MRKVCLGVGLDALTLAPTVMTTLVFNDEVFDEIFRGLVRRNAEGRLAVIGDQERAIKGLPFVAGTVHDLLAKQPMASPGAACLELAWHYRDRLLGDTA